MLTTWHKYSMNRCGNGMIHVNANWWCGRIACSCDVSEAGSKCRCPTDIWDMVFWLLNKWISFRSCFSFIQVWIDIQRTLTLFSFHQCPLQIASLHVIAEFFGMSLFDPVISAGELGSGGCSSGSAEFGWRRVGLRGWLVGWWVTVGISKPTLGKTVFVSDCAEATGPFLTEFTDPIVSFLTEFTETEGSFITEFADAAVSLTLRSASRSTLRSVSWNFLLICHS